MSIERARAIADAVLLEGYALYPYRASSRKNQYRFTFGVLAPRTWADGGGCEASWLRAECLVLAQGDLVVVPTLRFLQQRKRKVERPIGDNEMVFAQVDSMDVEGDLYVSWDEGELRELAGPAVSARGSGERTVSFHMPGSSEVELLTNTEQRVLGRIVRESQDITLRLTARLEPVASPEGLFRVSVTVENVTPWSDPKSPRDAILGWSSLGTHLLLSAEGGGFLSLLDPPTYALEAARACQNVRTYPVLAGPPGSHDVVLAAPLIMSDHPAVAPESAGNFFDATEIDELLTLRTSTLTDEEKRAARATDPRTKEIVDRVERVAPETMDRLHGTFRDLVAEEMAPKIQTKPGSTRLGTRVRLRPGKRRTDAQDFLFAGRTATVEAVLADIDDRVCYAVTLDDDPARDLHRWYGRYHYYYADEVELVEDA